MKLRRLLRLESTAFIVDLIHNLGQLCWRKGGYLKETSIALQLTISNKFGLKKRYLWFSGFTRGIFMGPLPYKIGTSHIYKVFSKPLLGLKGPHVNLEQSLNFLLGTSMTLDTLWAQKLAFLLATVPQNHKVGHFYEKGSLWKWIRHFLPALRPLTVRFYLYFFKFCRVLKGQTGELVWGKCQSTEMGEFLVTLGTSTRQHWLSQSTDFSKHFLGARKPHMCEIGVS